MKKGNIVKINGFLGYLFNPEMKVIEVKNSMVLLERSNAEDTGALSCLNSGWYGIELIKNKIK